MRLPFPRLGLLVPAALLAACPDSALPDAGDGGDGSSLDAAGGPEVVAPSLPVFLPCPEGWVERGVGDLVGCEPFPAGPYECGPGEAHFTGERGCLPVGDPCPEGRFPELDDLPADRPLLFVDPLAFGGDGSRQRPLPTIASAAARAEPGTVIVLAKGTYEERVSVADEVTLHGACSRDVRLAPAGVPAIGGADGAQIALRNVTLGGPLTAFAALTGAGSRLTLDGVVVAGIAGLAGSADVDGREVSFRSFAFGALSPSASHGGPPTIRLSRAVFENNGPLLWLGARLVLSQVAIRRSSGLAAVHALEDLSLEAAVIEDAECAGLVVGGDETVVELRDTLVRGTRDCSDDTGLGGRAANLQEGASFDIERFWAEDNRTVGVLASTSTGTIRDLVVAGTQALEPASAGVGLVVARGASVTLERAYLTGNVAGGLSVVGSAPVVEDLTVVDTESRASDGQGGWGLVALAGASPRVSRVRLERNRSSSVVLEASGRLSLSDAQVLDSLPRPCVDATCVEEGFGSAVTVLPTTSLEMRRFVVDGGVLCGLHLAGGQVQLRDGRVSGFPIGVCAQSPGISLGELERGVVYMGNEANYRSTSLPVPETEGLFEDL